MSILSAPYFHDEAAAFAKLEEIVWPQGPVCPHCGNEGKIYELKGVRSKPSKKNPEGVERHGLKKCGKCRKQFTVRVGTVFESSHVALNLWFQAAYLLSSSKKGFSAHQLHRTLGVTYKTAWFMFHRLREAMRDGSDNVLGGLGGAGKTVEVDETYVGRKSKNKAFKPAVKKEVVLSLVERDGKVRSFHVADVGADTVKTVLRTQIDRASELMTDQAQVYRTVGWEFAKHRRVNHSIKEYVRGEDHTNTVESYFGIFKRGIMGSYHHVSQAHLKRYLCEFDFRYNFRKTNDMERTEAALAGIVGKRLTYRNPDYA